MAGIYINYGMQLQDVTYEIMFAADIKSKIKKSMHVVIKPNLAVARPADGGATTHPEIVEGIIQYLHDCGVERITIAEGSWVGDSTKKAWSVCGYTTLADKYGVSLVDTKSDGIIKLQAEKMELTLCETVANADYLINVPVLKGHCQTDVTCCLKNMKGCIPDSEKRRFHTVGLHKPIALLNTLLKPDLHIVDSVCGDLTFEEGGNPITANRVMLGFDGVELDSYGARLIGYEPEEVEHIRLAKEYGVGVFADASTTVTELNPEKRPVAQHQPSGAVKRMAKYIDEDSACSACYAALIYALHKSGTHGLAEKQLHIGQGFRGRELKGIGIGKCTSGCECSLPGCPPKAVDIMRFLEDRGR